MKKILLTLLFTVLSYAFIYYTTGYTGRYLYDYIEQKFNVYPVGFVIIAAVGNPFAYVYIAFKYSRNRILSKYQRLFFQLYSPWAILGYSIMMLFAMTNPEKDFSVVFSAYSSALFISIMIIITVNLVSLRALLEPVSGFAKSNMKLIFISDILLISIIFIMLFIFGFNNTL